MYVRLRRGPVTAYRAFTLIELLVVLAIISLLTGLLLPAVQAARQAARRVQCQNNLRQIGMGLNAYHAAYGSYPPGGIEWRPRGNTTNRQLAWSALLLPFLEEQALADSLDLDTPFDSPENAQGAARIVSVYVCPASQRGARLVHGRGPCDYGGIYGERITSPNSPPKGVMLYDKPIAIRDVTDGTAKTLIVGEDSRFDDGQWINGRNIFDQAFPINAAPDFENDIRSEHGGGANVVRCDGSVHFLAETMNIKVLAALCTRAGGEMILNE
jgi:prepilin-type N-terminal cleavage/methylation domain-containing protein/prepilin-type processing-associated H-X9-DG protein